MEGDSIDAKYTDAPASQSLAIRKSTPIHVGVLIIRIRVPLKGSIRATRRATMGFQYSRLNNKNRVLGPIKL